MAYFGSYFGPTTSGGGGCITLAELQAELAIIKGEGFDPETDTLAKIAEGTGSATSENQEKLLKIAQAQQSK